MPTRLSVLTCLEAARAAAGGGARAALPLWRLARSKNTRANFNLSYGMYMRYPLIRTIKWVTTADSPVYTLSNTVPAESLKVNLLCSHT